MARLTLLPELTITTAGEFTGEMIPFVGGATELVVQAVFDYGSGGTSVTVWVQTSIDGGATWLDIACFQFTTADDEVVIPLTTAMPAAPTTTGDGVLAPDEIINGLIGDALRVKGESIGTYAGDTTLTIKALTKG